MGNGDEHCWIYKWSEICRKREYGEIDGVGSMVICKPAAGELNFSGKSRML